MSEYPQQIYSKKRDGIVLAVDALYSLPNMGKESTENPLEAPGYSRCKITLIDKTGSRVLYPYANVPEDDIYYIKSLTDIALQQMSAIKAVPSATTAPDLSGEAFTQRFPSGIYRNMTPADVLRKTPEARGTLLQMHAQLTKNSGKFAKSIALAKGIGQALELFSSGALAESYDEPISIYSEKEKFLLSTRDAEERCMIYDIDMICHPLLPAPFELQIRNYYAFLLKETNSFEYHVNRESIVDEVVSSFLMSKKEFVSMVNKMFYTMRDFNTVNFARRYSLSKELAKKAHKAMIEGRKAAEEAAKNAS